MANEGRLGVSMRPSTDHPHQEDPKTLISTQCVHLAGPHTSLSFPRTRNPTGSKLLLEAHDAQSMSLGMQRVELRLGKEQRSWGGTGRTGRPPERMGRRRPSPLASAAASLPLDHTWEEVRRWRSHEALGCRSRKGGGGAGHGLTMGASPVLLRRDRK